MLGAAGIVILDQLPYFYEVSFMNSSICRTPPNLPFWISMKLSFIAEFPYTYRLFTVQQLVSDGYVCDKWLGRL